MVKETVQMKVKRIHRLKTESPLKAFVDISVNEAFLIKGVRIVEGRDGLFVTMPQEKAKDNRWYDTVRCLSKDVMGQLSDEVLKAYSESN